jgi:hypothetical protein
MPPWIWMFSAVAWKYASRAVGLGERGHRGQLVVQLGGAPQAVVRGALGRLDLEQHVGALVLDGLERTDRATELHADLGVLDGHLEHLLGATDLLGGEADGGEVEHALSTAQPSPSVPMSVAGVFGELELGLLAGLVHGAERGAGEARGAAVDGEQADALGGAGGDDDEVRGVAVEHEHLGAVERVAVARGGGLHGDAALVPLAVGLGEGEGGDGLAAGDARQVRGLGGVVTAVDQGVGGQHDGEKNGAHSRARPISSSTMPSST